jgi:hypothetical protein
MPMIDIVTSADFTPPASVTCVSPVAPMHEEVEDRAQQKDRPGKDAQDVRLMLLP